ncbi:MAG: FAD-dependent oxidoreductase [Pedosphaera sp.]|nr:FAD-dependent oxidoreductase [Pedosphaera sp.]|tara:strand:+ start:379 stop:1401 length:1023 start_codon:yes stop_codon:yes gene_type:complete
MAAWELAKAGHSVELIEKSSVMSATSSASTKLLHGGMRYLEHGKFSLVRESLRERAWWLEAAPDVTQVIPILFPIFQRSPRSRWTIKLGMVLYDRLAGKFGVGKHRWVSCAELTEVMPNLKSAGLKGAYLFYDGQMDDYALGLWATEQAKSEGVTVLEHTQVDCITADGSVEIQGNQRQYDRVVNVAGPWAVELLKQSGLPYEYDLDLVRGSHLLLDRNIKHGMMLTAQTDGRLFFVLPYKGKTLLGTTEVRQDLSEPVVCSESETDYLITVYNDSFDDSIDQSDVLSSFAGLRPLLKSHKNPNRATREYRIEQHEKVISVFGGKWTTARALAKKITAKL